ncbi:hypothetical protein A2765_00910 [Candidatus Kaiserbacteria bacterium RIFCSPHIGHO2_01_FULL_56_24]|uniref:Uncharacterized protein n=1 Tax=Candidatus Kaiserbacteria bacterium RIFCSPHIGHO2_01_FULL_56_24 TaxID=1798487 RepID=A0A1F6DFB1_9BACT|nr:MAG: hypothetical protein A2765_00910 [Candidatus Kaiserbacteria bacterium RIFCSPHIGHO2_01_FULL_56_24]
MDLHSVTGFFTGIPLDWIILGVLVILIALDSLRSGIGRACAIALALPVAVLLYSLVEKTAVLGTVSALSATPMAQAITFGVIAVVCYLLVRRMALEYVESGTGEPIQALLAGGATTIVFIIAWEQVPALQSLWHMSDRVNAIFSESYRLIWLLGAYVGLAFARG